MVAERSVSEKRRKFSWSADVLGGSNSIEYDEAVIGESFIVLDSNPIPTNIIPEDEIIAFQRSSNTPVIGVTTKKLTRKQIIGNKKRSFDELVRQQQSHYGPLSDERISSLRRTSSSSDHPLPLVTQIIGFEVKRMNVNISSTSIIDELQAPIDQFVIEPLNNITSTGIINELQAPTIQLVVEPQNIIIRATDNRGGMVTRRRSGGLHEENN